MVAEKKRMEAPAESRGVSKEKWLEDRKKKVGRLLDANGLDMKKAYAGYTEAAESKYKKWEKDPAPFGWMKRTKNVEVDIEEYNKLKEEDPEFYGRLQVSNTGRLQRFLKAD
ncbi:RNA-directed RNA polymerase L [Bienertia sinuspersici]